MLFFTQYSDIKPGNPCVARDTGGWFTFQIGPKTHVFPLVGLSYSSFKITEIPTLFFRPRFRLNPRTSTTSSLPIQTQCVNQFHSLYWPPALTTSKSQHRLRPIQQIFIYIFYLFFIFFKRI